jgi:hypothetical protein
MKRHIVARHVVFFAKIYNYPWNCCKWWHHEYFDFCSHDKGSHSKDFLFACFYKLRISRLPLPSYYCSLSGHLPREVDQCICLPGLYSDQSYRTYTRVSNVATGKFSRLVAFYSKWNETESYVLEVRRVVEILHVIWAIQFEDRLYYRNRRLLSKFELLFQLIVMVKAGCPNLLGIGAACDNFP